MKKLSIEHPFFDFMGSLGDWMILNVLFVLTSLPVTFSAPTVRRFYFVNTCIIT